MGSLRAMRQLDDPRRTKTDTIAPHSVGRATIPDLPEHLPHERDRHSSAETAVFRAPDLQEEATGDEKCAFELGKMVGFGAMGEVFEAVQLSLGREVAVKTIRRDAWEWCDDAQQNTLKTEFVQESLIAARLEHPNIAPVHDLGFTQSGKPLLAMKLVRGEAWSRMIARDIDTLSEAEFLARHLPILEDMAQAVAFAHSRGIMHRDLKPSQVMVGAFGETQLMDWGLALRFAEFSETVRILGESCELPTTLTASNPAGTPALMAPEQTEQSPRRLGPHTDVYLLGGTLYLLLTGRFPHDAPSPAATMMKAAIGVITPPHIRTPDRWIPEDLAALAMKALEPEIAARIPTAELFIQGLRDYLSGANRRRESEALVAEVETILRGNSQDEPKRQAYTKHVAISERLGRAMELWPHNKRARQLSAGNLAVRIRLEIAGGDLQQAEIHLEELILLVSKEADLQAEIPVLEEDLRKATRHREKQHRQRVRFAWAAGILFFGHVIGMTYAVVSGKLHARELRNQQEEMKESLSISRTQIDDGLNTLMAALPLDRTEDTEAIRHQYAIIGDLLSRANRPREASTYLRKALLLHQNVDGPDSLIALELSNKLKEALEAAEASEALSVGPPPESKGTRRTPAGRPGLRSRSPEPGDAKAAP